MTTNLHTKLFGAADHLRSKMDASEYKNYLLGLIFYKYLSDKLLVEVVELSGAEIQDYPTKKLQVTLYHELTADSDAKEALEDAMIDKLGYTIKEEFLFSELAEKAKQNIFQLNDLKQGF